jgi:hypothetical protein
MQSHMGYHDGADGGWRRIAMQLHEAIPRRGNPGRRHARADGRANRAADPAGHPVAPAARQPRHHRPGSGTGDPRVGVEDQPDRARPERETGFAEFKTYLRGPGRILRGRTPELARQELRAYLVIYQAIRAVICLAAADAGLDPDRISFTATLHAIRRTLTSARTSPDAALAETEACILTELIPRREGRVCVRAVTRPSSPFPSKRNAKGPLAQHTHCTVTTRTPHQAPPTTTDQPKHPASRENKPP